MRKASEFWQGFLLYKDWYNWNSANKVMELCLCSSSLDWPKEKTWELGDGIYSCHPALMSLQSNFQLYILGRLIKRWFYSSEGAFFRRYRRSSSSMHRSQAPKSRVIERPPNLTTRVLLWSSPLLQCYLFWLITPFMVLYNEKKWKNDRWIHSLCSISITRLFGWHLRLTRNMKEHWHYYTAFWASPFELCYYTLFWGDRAIERWYTLQLLSHENFLGSCILI